MHRYRKALRMRSIDRYEDDDVDTSEAISKSRIGMKWRIKEEEVKNIEDYGYLQSKTFKTNIPGVEYFLQMYPNGKTESERNNVIVVLHVDCKMPVSVYVTFSVNVKSVPKSFSLNGSCEAKFPEGFGKTLCTRDELFNAAKKFFVDGIMEIELKGTLKNYGMKPKAAESLSLARRLREDDDTKDTAIAVGEQEIMVHKCVVSACSSVFKAALNNSRFKEASENKIVITDFCFDTVQIAAHYCYELNIDDQIEGNASELLHFADKYDMKELHGYVEAKLIKVMSVENVCAFANMSVTSNANDLREYCICFLMNALSDATVINGFEDLNNDIKLEVVHSTFNSFCF